MTGSMSFCSSRLPCTFQAGSDHRRTPSRSNNIQGEAHERDLTRYVAEHGMYALADLELLDRCFYAGHHGRAGVEFDQRHVVRHGRLERRVERPVVDDEAPDRSAHADFGPGAARLEALGARVAGWPAQRLALVALLHHEPPLTGRRPVRRGPRVVNVGEDRIAGHSSVPRIDEAAFSKVFVEQCWTSRAPGTCRGPHSPRSCRTASTRCSQPHM